MESRSRLSSSQCSAVQCRTTAIERAQSCRSHLEKARANGEIPPDIALTCFNAARRTKDITDSRAHL